MPLNRGQAIPLKAQEETRVPHSEATPLAPYGQNTVWPADLSQRVITLEAQRDELWEHAALLRVTFEEYIADLKRENAALRERLVRIEARLLLPEKPNEP